MKKEMYYVVIVGVPISYYFKKRTKTQNIMKTLLLHS